MPAYLSFSLSLTHLAGHNGGKILLLIHKHQVLEGSWLEEKSVSFLQRHSGRELWFIIIISQVSNLVQITNKERAEVKRDI